MREARRAWHVLGLGAVLAAALAACGDREASGSDGGDAAGLHDGGDASPPCTPEFGRTYVIDQLTVLGEDQGDDLDGDGIPDNALHVMALIADSGYAESFADGTIIYLFDVLDWSDPPDPDAGEVRVAFYEALDADVPADPSNNFSGTADFLAPATDFDMFCRSTTTFDAAAISGGTLVAHASTWVWVLPYGGTMRMDRVTTRWTFQDDYTHIAGTLTGVLSACALANAMFPGSTNGYMLPVIIANWGTQPDIDIDGDGLEQIVVQASKVAQCIDGDGTVIDGEDCPCDPRILDGYSMAYAGTGVSAHLVGLDQAF